MKFSDAMPTFMIVGITCSIYQADANEPIVVKEGSSIQRLTVEVLDTFAHDPSAFTQGLELHDGVLYESTGIYGSSDIRLIDPSSGDVLHSQHLPSDEFAEGLTLTDDVLWQLTWKAGVAYQRDPTTLDVKRITNYDGEGWGLCFDESQLVMSDGSSSLFLRDPVTFEIIDTVQATLDGEPLDQLNELECVDGHVWANVWKTDQIIRIDPTTGEIGAVVDASGLLTEEEAAAADVLNGIAAAEADDTYYLTGKHWPRLFLVRFIPSE